MPFTLPTRAKLLSCFQDLQDTALQSECAELLRASGYTDSARLLYDAVFIQTGFSPDCIRAQSEIAARTCLWGDVNWGGGAVVETAAAQRLELASLQLRQLLDLREESREDVDEAPAGAVSTGADFPEMCAQLCAALRRTASVESVHEISSILTWMSKEVTGDLPFAVEENVGEATPVLARELALSALQAFLLARLDIIGGDYGSAGIFHAISRLSAEGLGPYLNQAMTLAAGNEDRSAAITQLLHGQSRRDLSAQELVRRGVTLSLGLHGVALTHLVDALANAGAMQAVQAIFLRAQAAASPESDVLFRHIRAVGLGSENIHLALQAQQTLVKILPNSADNWIMLGDIEALAGNRPKAEQAYEFCLRLRHGDAVATQRLDALRRGAVGKFIAMTRSATKNGGNTARSSTIERVLRRSLLRLALTPFIAQDQIDCAELAFATGFSDAARALYDVIFIVSGFSPSAIERQQRIEQRLLLWTPTEGVAGSIDSAASAVSPKAAVEQLALIFVDAGSTLQPIPDEPLSAWENEGAQDRAAPTAGIELRSFCDRFKQLLRQKPSSQSSIGIRQALTWLERNVTRRPPVPSESYCGLDTNALAEALAFNILRDFALANRSLAHSPFGSAELFHAAARLDEAGLGPYFARSIEQLAETRDLFGLIQIASGRTRTMESRRDSFERWSVLLSSGFGPAELRRLVEELGDLGLLRAVSSILDRASKQTATRFDPGLLWSVRDAGLDNRDFDLALRAQRLVVAWRPQDHVEWIVLGEIEATARNIRQAAAAFERALAFFPSDQAARERLDALETGDFQKFKVTGGYGTSLEQKRVRRRNLQAA